MCIIVPVMGCRSRIPDAKNKSIKRDLKEQSACKHAKCWMKNLWSKTKKLNWQIWTYFFCSAVKNVAPTCIQGRAVVSGFVDRMPAGTHFDHYEHSSLILSFGTDFAFHAAIHYNQSEQRLTTLDTNRHRYCTGQGHGDDRDGRHAYLETYPEIRKHAFTPTLELFMHCMHCQIQKFLE